MDKKQVAGIVSAYLNRNQVPATELAAVIASVSEFLNTLGQVPAPPEPIMPVVSIRVSIRPDFLICLACGHKSKMLMRHLQAAHSWTPDLQLAKHGRGRVEGGRAVLEAYLMGSGGGGGGGGVGHDENGFSIVQG